jgi:hypothetical protein
VTAAGSRAAYGAALCIVPRRGALREVPRPVLLALGLRNLGQALLLRRPTRASWLTSAVVDATHAASCLAIAAFWPEHRRVAIAGAVVGGSFTGQDLFRLRAAQEQIA